jgi:hypothetical protein
MVLDPTQRFAQDRDGDRIGDKWYRAFGRTGVACRLIRRFEGQRIDDRRIIQLCALAIEIFDSEHVTDEGPRPHSAIVAVGLAIAQPDTQALDCGRVDVGKTR